MATHLQVQHGVFRGEMKYLPSPRPPYEAGTYHILFPWAACDIYCPVVVLPGRETSCSTLWVHFVYRRVQDTVVILEEWSQPLPR